MQDGVDGEVKMIENEKLLTYIMMQLNQNGSLLTEILRQISLTNLQLGIDISSNLDNFKGLVKQSNELNTLTNTLIDKLYPDNGKE